MSKLYGVATYGSSVLRRRGVLSKIRLIDSVFVIPG